MNKEALHNVTVEITNRCQLKCRMCGIWREPVVHEIGADDFTGTMQALLARFTLGSVSLTGGEPFLHRGVGSMLRTLARLRLEGRIKAFGFYTNGTLTHKILRLLERDWKYLRGLSVGISLDGRQEAHDRIRGRGAWQRSVATIRALRKEFSGECDLEIKYTAGLDNAAELYPVYLLAAELGARFTPKLVESGVGNYYHRSPCTGPVVPVGEMAGELRTGILAVLKDARVRANGARQPTLVNVALLRLLLKLLAGGPRSIQSCLTPEKCLFITSRGDIYPCLYMRPAGSIYGAGIADARFLRNRVKSAERGRSGGCPRCLAYHGILKEINIKGVR